MIIYDEHGKVTPEFVEYEKRLDGQIQILVESAFNFLTLENNGQWIDYELLKSIITEKLITELHAHTLRQNT